MKEKIFILLLIVTYPALMKAQPGGITGKIANKIKGKTTARIEKKVDQAIDNTLDIMGGNIQTGSKKEAVLKETGSLSDTTKRMYIKYDFVPGEHIIYSNDFSTDNMGEMPTGWNSNGNAAVVI